MESQVNTTEGESFVWEEHEAELDRNILGESVVGSNLLESSEEDEGEDRKHLSAKHKHTFCNTFGEKRKGSAGSILCLEDDRIVVSDFMWSKLKVYDKDYNYCFSADCSRKSVITHYSGNEIALAARETKEVKFYIVEKNRIVELPKHFQLEHEVYNIEYGNNHFGLLLRSDKFYIGILDEDGVERYAINSVKTEEYKLRICLYFCMDPTENRVYIGDGYNYKISCLTYKGEVMFEVPIRPFIASEIILIESVILVAVSTTHVLATRLVGNHYTTRLLLTKKDHLVNPSLLALQPKSKCILVANGQRDHRDFVQAFQLTWSEA